MDPSAALQALHPVIASLQRGKNVHYLHVSAACLFAYDYMTTFSDEVEYIWNAKWTIGKILFLVVRYITWPELFIVLYIELFDVPSPVCHGVFTYTTWSIVAGITLAETVLILRTWAIWEGRQSVVFTLGSVLFAITVSNCYIVVQYVDVTRVLRAAEVLPGIVGCVVVSSSHKVGIAWISISAFELVIVAMTLIKGIEHFRSSSSTLLASLYRDGILYFVFLFSVSLANMIFVYTAPQEYIVLLAELQRAFHAILSCRIILHLRAAYATSVQLSGPATSTAMFTEDFRRGGRETESVAAWFGNFARSRGAPSTSRLSFAAE